MFSGSAARSHLLAAMISLFCFPVGLVLPVPGQPDGEKIDQRRDKHKTIDQKREEKTK